MSLGDAVALGRPLRSVLSFGVVTRMEHETSKTKALLRDWRWILVVSLLLAVPTYGFTAPMRYALVAHIIATLAYVGLLLLFGDGFVIEGALVVLILATFFAFCSRPLHRAIHRVSAERPSPNQTLERMTRSAVSRMFQYDCPWRAPRHRSALR
jgi:hypothetical protein